MTIDWFHLSFALFLLWLPRQLLRLGPLFRKRRSHRFKDTNPARTRQPGDPTVSFREEWGKFRNYVDLMRGALGSVALVGWLPGVTPAILPAGDAPTTTVQLVFWIVIAVLVLGVLIQSLRFEVRISVYAPIFYITGISLGACGPTVSLFAFALLWTINMALPNPTALLSVYALLVAAFTGLFEGLDRPLAFVMAGLCFLPVLVSLLIRRPLVVMTKKSKASSAAATGTA